MTRVRYITVLFKKTQRTQIFRCSHPEIDVGNDVLVKGQRGLEVGEVVSIEDEADTKVVTQVEGKVVRRLRAEDYDTLEELAREEEKAKRLCEQKIAELGLQMKLLDVEYLFDGHKATFYFTAEQRVDFRELVRQLANELRVRVEMRQIGVRDEARMIGGLGPCGRNLCCATFLHEFEPVSIRMAKEQGLPVNTFKISGLCGRLMCCLKYEYDNYTEFQKCAPPVGAEVTTPLGRGRIAAYQVARDAVVVEFESGAQQLFRLGELEYKGRRLEPCWAELGPSPRERAARAEMEVEGREAPAAEAAGTGTPRVAVAEAGEEEAPAAPAAAGAAETKPKKRRRGRRGGRGRKLSGGGATPAA